jgi:DNA-binding beta-propeller fold protein YncE
MLKLFIYAVLISILFSCSKTSDNNGDSYLAGSGVFILNEGNFFGGTGSLSFYSYDSAKMYNDIFAKVNGRPLGSVPNAMYITGSKAYIVVNNSGKIEVVNLDAMESIGTINKLNSPRNMAFINAGKAYVTSLYSDSLTIVNLNTNTISGYINLRRTSESVLISDNMAYVSNWSGGREIMVINVLNDKVTDSISVGNEPESMVLDKYKKLWVLCNGGWSRQNFAELNVINTATNKVEKKIVFPSKTQSPTSLTIDSKGETLYYLEKGVHQMEGSRLFYKLGINPLNNDVVVSDAVDYQQKGSVMIFRNDGTPVDTEKADIIPGSLCFKINVNYFPL